MNGPNEIMTFDGQYRFLSNFYLCQVYYAGRYWPSSEHAYQAAKTHDPAEKDLIFNAKSPGVAKREGDNVTKRPDWADVKVSIMFDILESKFSNKELEERLLSTGNVKLIEGNTWDDRFWGVDIRTRVGQNMLGKLLMQIRENKISFD